MPKSDGPKPVSGAKSGKKARKSKAKGRKKPAAAGSEAAPKKKKKKPHRKGVNSAAPDAHKKTAKKRHKKTTDTAESAPGEHGYKHPIPPANEILAVLEAEGVPLKLISVSKLLDVRGQKNMAALKKRLGSMVRGGQILKNRQSEYCLVRKINGIAGKISSHPDGFGFLIPEDGSEDLFIPFHEMRSLLDGDRIVARVSGTSRNGKRKGSVVEILERGKEFVVGRFHREHGVSFVVEQNSRSPHNYLVPNHQRGGAQPGQMVKLEIVDYPTKHREPYGKIVEVLGDSADAGMVTTLAIEAFEIPSHFPDAVIKKADDWGDAVRDSDKAGRVDIRDLPLVTIDGADARDFDDAVFAEATQEGWRLIVAIADVSHYVTVKDAIDKEAVKRGTSVYFADRVVPMLPESLSNGLCSLNPNVDRLCMVCDMQVTSAGKVKSSKFYKGLMRSHARLTYSQVNAAVQDKDADALKLVGERLPQLETLYELYAAFSKQRNKRGALELEIPEVRISMGEDGHIDRIAPVHRNDAHKLIEECMIAANVEAGRFLHKNKMPTLYRVHEGPSEDRFEELRVLLQELGIKVAAEVITKPAEMNRILQELSERPDFAVMATAVLRTMSRAVYQPQKIGHFGLALDTYAHFTSPIRRYPDLLVHRGIQHIVEGGKPGKFAYDADAMDVLGRSTSACEKRADDATRDVEARYKCLYVQDHVGETFKGVVTGVTHFGLFITLNDLYVEGLVHVTGLNNDYYQLEHGGLQLRGERTGRTFGLGDELEVRVSRVDIDDAKIDLSLVEAEQERASQKEQKKDNRSGRGRKSKR